jgi:hypothetical protein
MEYSGRGVDILDRAQQYLESNLNKDWGDYIALRVLNALETLVRYL